MKEILVNLVAQIISFSVNLRLQIWAQCPWLMARRGQPRTDNRTLQFGFLSEGVHPAPIATTHNILSKPEQRTVSTVAELLDQLLFH